MPELDFTGRVVIVTGAGGCLGKAYALEFAKRGASVVVNDLGTTVHGSNSSSSSADQASPSKIFKQLHLFNLRMKVVAEIRSSGGKAEPNYDSVEFGDKIVETAIKNFGRVDVVINNAGILRDRTFQKLADEDWDLVFRTHVKGAVSITKAAWPYFKKQQFGRIIFTSSNSAIYGNFGQANYAAAKSALIGLSHTLAKEGIKYNIQSNVVVPTAWSRLTADLLPYGEKSLKPEYVAPLVVYLAHESCEETGKIFEAAAGWYGQIQAYRSKGMVLPAADAETIAKNWTTIRDMTSATHFDNIEDVTVELLSCAETSTEARNGMRNDYMLLLKAVARAISERRYQKTDAGSVVTFLIKDEEGSLTELICSDQVDASPLRSNCVITIEAGLIERIIKGQLVTVEDIKSGKLRIVGEEDEDVIKCFNEFAGSSKSKL